MSINKLTKKTMNEKMGFPGTNTTENILNPEDQKEFDNLGKEKTTSIDEMISQTDTPEYRKSLGLGAEPDHSSEDEFNSLKPQSSAEIMADLDKKISELKN